LVVAPASVTSPACVGSSPSSSVVVECVRREKVESV
jgi:hypothetical protein